jgi:hypothetical protein
MTEEEAKTKWCPFARYVETDSETGETASPAYNRDSIVIESPACLCIGSACMAWRWAAIPNPDYKPGNYQVWPAQQPVGDPWIQSDTLGGCGLAGKP